MSKMCKTCWFYSHGSILCLSGSLFIYLITKNVNFTVISGFIVCVFVVGTVPCVSFVVVDFNTLSLRNLCKFAFHPFDE